MDEDPRRVRVLRRRLVPRRHAADPPRRLRARGGRQRRGQALLHLQCHFGLDTLSWARLGAIVTGLDFSAEAIAAARALAADVGLDGDLRPVRPLRRAGGARGRVRHRLHVARRPRLAAGHRGLGARRGPFRPARRASLRDRDPPGRAGLRGRGRRARRAAARAIPYWSHAEPTRFDVKGSYADRDAPTEGLRGARLGPLAGRDRHRADRCRAADRLPPRVPLRPSGRSTSWSRARTGVGACRRGRRASCRCSSR